jgi:hypothetical protein
LHLWQVAIRGWLIPGSRLMIVMAVRRPNVDAGGNGSSGKDQ